MMLFIGGFFLGVGLTRMAYTMREFAVRLNDELNGESE